MKRKKCVGRKVILRHVSINATDEDTVLLCQPYTPVIAVSRGRFRNGEPKRTYNVYVKTSFDADALKALHGLIFEGWSLDVEIVPPTPEQQQLEWVEQMMQQLGKTNQESRYLIRRIGEVLGTAFIEDTVKRSLSLQANGGLTDREGKLVTSINAIFKSLVHAALEDRPQAWEEAFHTPLPSRPQAKS